MKKMKSRYSDIVLNLLVALAISLVVNFSYLLLLLVEQRSEPLRSASELAVEFPGEGILNVDPDGHGYIVYDSGDSVYVPMARLRRLDVLQNGDHLVVVASPPRQTGAHPIMTEVKLHNGEPFDYGKVYNRTSRTTEFILQFFYYLVMSFVLLLILTSTRHNYSAGRFARACLWCLLVTVVFYALAPVTDWHTGRIGPNFMRNSRGFFDYMLPLKFMFAAVVAMLYGRIYVLLSQRQAVTLENAQLKTENLTTRYNMLMGQINPHFLFNSLNSLAMLVRAKEDDKALTYIDQLSYTFRYIIQNGQSTMIPLSEELRFVDAYSYLFKIRYADKLFFDIDIEERYLDWLLPAFSLQPLLDNAVKHNAITRSNPFHITIRTDDGWLMVSNPKVKKIEQEPSTGIGLENLRSRWHLIAGCEIEIVDTPDEFTVRMPLHKSES